MQAQARASQNHIQHQINDNIANLPIFCGKTEKDTVTLKYYASHANQGVSTLIGHKWMLLIFLKIQLNSPSANWFDYWTTFNRYDSLEWEVIKPHFSEALGDTTDPMVFAKTMFGIKLSSYKNNLYDYTNTNTKVINLHKEKFLANHPPLVYSHGLTAAQQVQRANDLNRHGHAIHDKFQN